MARIRRYMGRVEIWLDPRERAAVLAMIQALGGDDLHPRLRPRAYEDADLDREYQRLVRPELDAIAAADVAAVREDLATTEPRCRLDEERALAWLRALNRLRLVAGGRLGIEDDGWDEAVTPEHLERAEMLMLHELGWLQEGIVEALESS